MAFYHRVPTKYLTLVPAIFFAAIGSFDIITDATDHQLTIANVLFNSLLFIPLVLRHWLVYIISGVLACLFAAYGSFAIFVWTIQYFQGAHFSYPFQTFVIGPLFAFITMLFGVSLIYAGRKISYKRATVKPQAS